MHSNSTSKLKRYVNLGSSSQGNAFFYEFEVDGNRISFLLECGFSMSELLTRASQVEVDLSDLDFVLVSHEHKDHAESVKEFVSFGIPVYAPESVFKKFKLEVDEYYYLKAKKVKVVNEFIKVYPLDVEHLDDKKEPVETLAFIIVVNKELQILFITDTKYIKYDLSDYRFDIVMIESNHFMQMSQIALRQYIEKNDAGMVSRYERLIQSHMSVEACAKTLKSLDLSNTKIITLIHLTTGNVKGIKFVEYIQNSIGNPKIKVSYANMGVGFYP